MGDRHGKLIFVGYSLHRFTSSRWCVKMDTSAATGKMHAPGSGGVPEKCSVPGGEKRMTKLLHGNEKSSLTGGREPLFSQK